MRWPWQQRKTAASESPVPAAESSAPVARPHAEWRQVGGLRPTVDPHAPTLIAAGLPVIASTRSLLHRERTSPDVPAVPPGRVSGLTSVFPAAPTVAAAEPDARPAVVARVHPAAPLTRAVAEYVGEARVPAVPHRAPAWLKAASNQPPVFTPLDAFVTKPAEDSPVSREIAMLDSWASPPAVVPSEPEAEAAPDEPVTPPVPMIRRRRRPGLGQPLPPGERPPASTSTPRPAAVEPPKPRLVRPETPEPVSVPTPVLVPEPEPVPEPVMPVAEGAAGPELVHPAEPTRSVEPDSVEPARPAFVDRAEPEGVEPPPPVVAGRVVPARFSARIPNDIVETFERSYGVELADVTVDRSPVAAAEAKSIGAKAFARDDLIVLPEEAGPVESVETRALIGHELAHVVQQRTIGTMPTESDADGQRLEAAARSVEEWVRAGAAGPPPPVIPPAPPRPGAPPEATERPGPVPVRRRASAGPPSGAGAPQRAVTGVATDPAPATTSSGPHVTTSTSPTTTTAPSLVHPTATTDTHPENPQNAHQFGTLLRDSLAGMGADIFGFGSLLGGQSSTPQTPHGTTSTTTPATSGTTRSATGATGTTGTTGPTFNRDRRREQLTNDALERLNLVRAEQGQAPLTELPATEAAAIESQLDSEQGAGGSSNTAADAPVIENWHQFGDQFRLAGGELVGSLFGINPIEQAERRRHEAEAARQQQQQQQQGTSGTHTASTAGAAAAAGVGAGAAAHAVGHPDRPATPDPTGAELARLYDRIHTRLVRELLVGRERSGSLMDFR